MLIKESDDRSATVAALERLAARPGLDPAVRSRIDEELRMTRAGVAGEREAAYDIDFHYKTSPNYAVIHDLRIEQEGRVAQIDHLILTRLFQLWVCETKQFVEGVGVNDRSEWVSFYRGRERGIPSPIEQNKRHMFVLDKVLHSDRIRLPKRLGITLRPTLRSLVLVSNKAIIKRPGRAAAARVDGLDSVIKVERLQATIDASFDAEGAIAFAKLALKRELEDVGRQLAALHVPEPIDGIPARFGLQPAGAAPAMASEPADPSPVPTRKPGNVCASCGARVSGRVIAFCRQNHDRFGGEIYCMDCQRRFPMVSKPLA